MDAVAERRLELRTENGTVEAIARLGIPKEVSVDEWTCSCITNFANEERSIEIHGADSMQALQLAMATLDAELHHGAKRRGGTLYRFDEPFVSILEDSGMQRRAGDRGRCQMAPDTSFGGRILRRRFVVRNNSSIGCYDDLSPRRLARRADPNLPGISGRMGRGE